MDYFFPILIDININVIIFPNTNAKIKFMRMKREREKFTCFETFALNILLLRNFAFQDLNVGAVHLFPFVVSVF